jgi:hypothetical protein
MEADFALLRRDVRLTSTPKKAALELLRRKIEEARGERRLLPPCLRLLTPEAGERQGPEREPGARGVRERARRR